jgi:hypothetical protein
MERDPMTAEPHAVCRSPGPGLASVLAIRVPSGSAGMEPLRNAVGSPETSLYGAVTRALECAAPNVQRAAMRRRAFGQRRGHAVLDVINREPDVAVDAAADCTDRKGASVTTDQRGVRRPQGLA